MKSSKHQLLATTALVAAGSMAGGTALAEMMNPAMSVGGFFNHSTHFADQDTQGGNRGSISSRNNIEVFVKMGGELENGLKIGGRIELEGTGGGAAVRPDESWLDISAAWGTLQVGYTQSARYKESWAVQAPAAAYGVNSGHSHFWFDDSVGGMRFLRTLGSVNTDIAENQPTISYYTPRFNGFKLAGSYRYRANDGSAGQYGRTANEDTDYSNILDGSIHYAGDMGGIAFGVMLGAAAGSAPSTGGMCGNSDYQTMNAGIKASAQGFTVGAQLADTDDEARCASGTAMHAGAMYGQGPWSISITAFDGDVEQSPAPGEATYTAWSLGFGYTLGPGLKAVAAYQSADMDGEGDADNAGQAFMIGVNAAF